MQYQLPIKTESTSLKHGMNKSFSSCYQQYSSFSLILPDLQCKYHIIETMCTLLFYTSEWTLLTAPDNFCNTVRVSVFYVLIGILVIMIQCLTSILSAVVQTVFVMIYFTTFQSNPSKLKFNLSLTFNDIDQCYSNCLFHTAITSRFIFPKFERP